MDLETEKHDDEMSGGDFYYSNEDEDNGSDQEKVSEYDEPDCGDSFIDVESDSWSCNAKGAYDRLDSSSLPQEKYTVLSMNDIGQRQEKAVCAVTDVLSVSRAEACILLQFFNWNVSKVDEEWFGDEERVRKSAGLVHPGPQPTAKRRGFGLKELTCRICLELQSLDRMKATPACGHLFCYTCWTGYIHTAIDNGPGCLTLRCPDPRCHAAVGGDMIFALVSKEDGAKYRRRLFRTFVEKDRTFVEKDRTLKWCPAPGCEYAIEYAPGAGSYKIVCKCKHEFCWNCLEEFHSPVDCGTAGKWIRKNSAKSENVNWILANSKPCPQCKRAIEKNQGCMHMMCIPPCNFEFCWLCLGNWYNHDTGADGADTCNLYQAAKQQGAYDEEARRREMARKSVERYTHFYERWATNESARVKALSDLQQMQNLLIEKLSSKEYELVNEAWLQIVECRRVLKWTYSYGYFLPEDGSISIVKQQFFEYAQGEAEAYLERLHHCAEKELQAFLHGEKDTQKPFYEFGTKLACLTSATSTYFKNIVRALENGLPDFDIPGGEIKNPATVQEVEDDSSSNVGAEN